MDSNRIFRWRGMLAKTISNRHLSQFTGEKIFRNFRNLRNVEEKEDWAEMAVKVI